MSIRRSFTTALAVFIFAAPLAAQHAEPDAMAPSAVPATVSAPAAETVPVAAPAMSLAPTRDNGVVGVRTATTPFTPLARPAAGENSRNTALMIIGGATLLVGAVVGGSAGTIIMITGGAIGLIGLWNYLN